MRHIIHRSKDTLLTISDWFISQAIISILFIIISQIVGYMYLVNNWQATEGLQIILIISSIYTSIIAIIAFLIAFLMLFYIFSILWPTSLWLLALSSFFLLCSLILGVNLVYSINYTRNSAAGYAWLQANYNQWWFVFTFILTIALEVAIIIFLVHRMIIWLFPRKTKKKIKQ